MKNFSTNQVTFAHGKEGANAALAVSTGISDCKRFLCSFIKAHLNTKLNFFERFSLEFAICIETFLGIYYIYLIMLPFSWRCHCRASRSYSFRGNKI